MHELGHTLALRHGGFENLNCKPNLSVMSYFSQFGVGKNVAVRSSTTRPGRSAPARGGRRAAWNGTRTGDVAVAQ
jgi:hypothetical protein